MKTIKRKLALAMAAVIAVCSVPSMPPAWARTARELEIVRFEELPEETLYQQVEYGTKKRSLDLPRYLYAEIREVYDDTDDEDDADEAVTATASNASAVKKATVSNAEKKTLSQKSSATPSNAAVPAATPSNATPSDADEYGSGDWKRVRVNWVLNESFSEQDEYDGEVPGIYVFEAELARDRYVLGDAELPWIEVEVLEKEEVLPVTAIRLMTGAMYDLSDAEVSVSGTYTYDGTAQEPSADDITVTLYGYTVDPLDYVVSFNNNTNCGSAIVEVTGRTSEYSGTGCGSFTIDPAALTVSGATFMDRVYDGTDKVTVTGVTLDDVISGDEVYANDMSGLTGTVESANVGTYTEVTLDGTVSLAGSASGNYTVTLPVTIADASVTISPKTVYNPTITLSQDTYEYDGTEKKPEVTVADGETEIPASEYAVSYRNNVNIGTATVIITDVTGGNYEINTSTTTFRIAGISLDGATVTVNGEYIYNSTEQTPLLEDIMVELNGERLSSADYTVSIFDNIHAGRATVTVTGVGDYSGSAEGNFMINPAELTVSRVETTSREYNGSNMVYVTGVTLDGVYEGDDVYIDEEIMWGGCYGFVDSADVGTYTDVFYIEELDPFLAGSNKDDYELLYHGERVSTNVTISPRTVDSPVISLSQDMYEYDGTAKKPDVTVKFRNKEIPASEYTVSYEDNVGVGTATVTIKDAYGGNYIVADCSTTFTITIAKVTVGAEVPASSTVKYSDSDSDDDSTNSTAVQASDGGQWILGERGWWYSNNSGGYPKGEWKQIDWLGSTNWYYFDEDG